MTINKTSSLNDNNGTVNHSIIYLGLKFTMFIVYNITQHGINVYHILTILSQNQPMFNLDSYIGSSVGLINGTFFHCKVINSSSGQD